MVRARFSPDDMVSRAEIAELVGVSKRTIVNYESRGLIAKGKQIEGYGSEIWYPHEEFLKLKRKMKKD